MKIIYLHGFASGPQSSKAQFFRARFEQRGVPFEIPLLDQGNFEELTVSGQLGVIDRAVHGEQVVMMGSSLGGYLAALYASRHPNVEKMVLLAPAFQFPSRWRKRYAPDMEEWKRRGVKPFYHYAFQAERPLSYRFVVDAVQYEDEPDAVQPALILHGTRDDVVPAQVSLDFAGRHPDATVRLLASGHELTDVLETLWNETAAFLGFQKQ